MKVKSSNWLLGYIALGITWGSSFLFIKWGLLSLSPLGVAFFRGFIGGVTLIIYSLITKQKFPKKLIEYFHIAVVALFLNSIPSFLFGLGEKHVSSITAGILNATTPLMTILVISIAFREQKINLNQWIGLLFGFLGVLLVTDVFNNKNSGSVFGIFVLLLATLCYGISMPYSRRYVTTLPYSSTALATTQVCSSVIILLPFVLSSHILISSWNLKSTLGMLLLGALGTGFAYIWNYRNVKLAGSTIASTVTYLTPVVATVLGFLFLKEKLQLIQYLGGVLILISAALVQGRIKIIRTAKTSK